MILRIPLILLWLLICACTGIAAKQTTAPPAQGKQEKIDPTKFDANKIEQLVFEETNRVRKKTGLKTLENSVPLARVAREHSDDMAKRQYFSHNTKKKLLDESFAKRVERLGYSAEALAENIAKMPVIWRQNIQTRTMNGKVVGRDVQNDVRSYSEMASLVVQGWLDSPGHRKNMMSGDYNRLGIGAALGQSEGKPYVYFTQDFSRE